MQSKSRNIQLAILGIASLVLSRASFLLINDPEGPNLLIVAVLAATIFSLTLAVFRFISLSLNNSAAVAAVFIGIAFMVYGGYDDSPGGQALGLLLAVYGVWRFVKRKP